MFSTTGCTWINTSRAFKTQLYKITKKATLLNRLLQKSLSLTYLILINLSLEADAFKVNSRLWELPYLQLFVTVFLVHHLFPKALNGCLQLLIIYLMIFLKLQCQKRNKENDCFKNM